MDINNGRMNIYIYIHIYMIYIYIHIYTYMMVVDVLSPTGPHESSGSSGPAFWLSSGSSSGPPSNGAAVAPRR